MLNSLVPSSERKTWKEELQRLKMGEGSKKKQIRIKKKQIRIKKKQIGIKKKNKMQKT